MPNEGVLKPPAIHIADLAGDTAGQIAAQKGCITYFFDRDVAFEWWVLLVVAAQFAEIGNAGRNT